MDQCWCPFTSELSSTFLGDAWERVDVKDLLREASDPEDTESKFAHSEQIISSSPIIDDLFEVDSDELGSDPNDDEMDMTLADGAAYPTPEDAVRVPER